MKQTKEADPHSTSVGERHRAARRSQSSTAALASTESEPHPVHDVAEARHLLKMLQERIGAHPELEAAVIKLEIALGKLTVQSGGLL